MSDSLVIANSVELLGGGVASVNPLCAGATFRLQPGFDLSAPQPTTDFVASLILDGERPFGRRASNRLIKLPIWITAPDRRTLAAAREVLEQAVDQDIWTITWTRDPGPGGTPLPLIIDCFRAQPTVPTYNTLFEKEVLGLQVTLTIPALPYGRADVQQQVSFAVPIPQTPPPPPPPVVIDQFSAISSSQCFQSSQCVIGPRSCCWDPDQFGDPGGQNTPFIYTASLVTPLNLTGMISAQMWLGFGSRYYTSLEYHGKTAGVSVYVTLTDTSGGTLGFSRGNLRLPCSPVAQQPVFSRVSMHIPQGSATFNYASVGGYTIEVINRHDRIRRLSWVTCYIDALTAYPPSQTTNPVPRGALYTLYGLAGTARAAATLAFQQPPSSGSPTTITATGVGNYTVPAGASWLKAEAVGGGGAGASLSGTGNGGGGSGAGYSAEPLFPCAAGQVVPYNVGAGGTAGASPVNGQATVFGPGPSGPLAVTAPGGLSAAYNSAAGAAPALASGNAVAYAGGGGRTASGSVGGGGGSSGGNASAGLSPSGTAATLFTTPGTFSGGAGWLCPPGVYQVYAEAWGGGGSGANGASGNGGGGGAGEYAAQYVNTTPGNYYGYTVAAGGAAVSSGGANGNPGGNSSFAGDNGTVTAHGGGAGLYETSSGGAGTAGSGSSNAVHFPGGAGGPAFPYSGSGGSSAGPGAAGNAGNGYGNATPAPAGGGAGGAGSGATGSNGQPGTQPGGGGGGTWSTVTTGAGGAGQVRLTYPGGAPTSNGAAAVPGGGAGGAGGPSANTAGSAGSQPGGAGGGACSTGTAEAGGAGGAGNLKITPYSSQPFKTLIVHRPPLGSLKTFMPLVPVGAGNDAPDGTRQYSMPQPLSGVNAQFGGTYTIYLIASSWNGSSQRSIYVTVTQYEYAGGPSYSLSTLPVTVTPAQVTNGILTAGVLTLPVRAVATDNAYGYYSVSVTDSNTSDRFYDCIFLDTMGQTVVINEPGAGYISYYLDAPEPNLDLGLIMGSNQGRPSAVSVYGACQAISGGAMAVEPSEGENQLFAYSADGAAPSVSLSYYPSYFFDRTQ